MGVDLRQNADASASWLNELDNKEVARYGGPRTADATATSPTYRAKKVMIVPLTAKVTAGSAVFSVQNLEPGTASWYVESVLLDITTGSTASATVKCDTGALATSSGSQVIAALDLSSASLYASWKDGAGTRTVVKVSNGNYLNLIQTSGDSTALVGFGIIGYYVG